MGMTAGENKSAPKSRGAPKSGASDEKVARMIVFGGVGHEEHDD